MLSDRSRPIIKATLAPVAGNIDQIARRFYEHMFGAHPDLLDGTFNRGNQAEGTQQAALAGSVATFAAALVNTPSKNRSICCLGSPTSTRRWGFDPISTRSSTTICSGPSPTSSVTRSPLRSPPPGTRFTG